ncbi:hypothetical protein OSB04_011224 [Centaurea solstitialis]|uniref:Uncharacterized protein n=1 Tax=Centaurea solstitialis TaxID=347529 RepID=A0AA38WLB4_9ASTR|nr:hypothetical protein OSB04_011224 [Centaurea solstitialis]
MRQRRWLEVIKDYDCEILNHPGKANVVEDALSRKGISLLLRVPCMRLMVSTSFRDGRNTRTRWESPNPKLLGWDWAGNMASSSQTTLQQQLAAAQEQIQWLNEQNLQMNGELSRLRASNPQTSHIPVSIHQQRPFFPQNPPPNDIVDIRLKMLEEQNKAMLALLTKLPGAAVPIEVEPKTGFQASPYIDEIALVDIPKNITFQLLHQNTLESLILWNTSHNTSS